MTAPLRAVLFDLDGTLIDTAPDFAYVIGVMRKRRQLDPIPYARILQTVSDGSRGLVEMAFDAPADSAEFETLRQELLTLYGDHLADSSRLFEGLDEALRDIEARGLRWGIVTNKPEQYAASLLRALKLDERCGALICPDHVAQRKPHPESLLLACAQLGCTAHEALFFGDHHRDIEAGRNAGMLTVACAYGYVHPEDPCSRWQADHIVNSPQDVLPLLRTFA